MKYGVEVGIGVLFAGIVMLFWPAESVPMGYTPAILFGYPTPLIGSTLIMISLGIMACTTDKTKIDKKHLTEQYR